MNNLLKQCLWQISFQYDFEKLLSLLYQVFKLTDRQTDRMNDRMTTKVLKTRPRVGAASPMNDIKIIMIRKKMFICITLGLFVFHHV